MNTPTTEENIDLGIVIGGLLRLHGRKWRGYVFKIIRNHADAEDVVQEAVRRVLSRNRTFHSADEVRMYLSRAVSNTAIEFYHARKRERLRQLPLSGYSNVQSESTNPEDRLEKMENSEQRSRVLALLGDGLSSLPLKQYEALQLTFMNSTATSIREAGVGTGIPYSTLRHRSIQGLRRLRRYVKRALRKSSAARISHQTPAARGDKGTAMKVR